MNTLISICIGNYNDEKYIGESIDSVLSQTYQNFEIIISDNNSTDNSINIIKNYSDKRIRLYTNSKKINFYENINRAMSYATGDLICILHSDDFYHEKFLAQVVKTYNQYPDQKVFVTGVYKYHGTKKILEAHAPYTSEGIKTQSEVITRLLYSNNIGNGVNVCIHRDVIVTAGMYSSAFCFASAYEFFLRAANYFDFVYISKMLTFQRVYRNNQMYSINKNLNMFIEELNISELHLEPLNLTYEQPYYRLIRHRVYIEAVEFAIKYKSGKILEQIFKEFFENKKFCSKDSTYYILELLGKFINENCSTQKIALLKFLCELTMFVPNIINEQRLEDLVANFAIETNASNKYEASPTIRC